MSFSYVESTREAAEYEFAVRYRSMIYPNRVWLGYGWKRYAFFGAYAGWKYDTRLEAMKSAGQAGFPDPVIVRFRVKKKCPKCGRLMPRAK